MEKADNDSTLIESFPTEIIYVCIESSYNRMNIYACFINI